LLLNPSVPPNQYKRDPELLERIEDHSFDPSDAKFTFAARLAEGNAWPQVFADRVIEEYRRFVYMACVSEHEVTPSDEVDQVWHLHLSYSRNYWEEFCPNVLRRPLHHGPTAGGAAEDARHLENYRRTLALYSELFNEDPPPEIWPPETVRFAPNMKYTRVNSGLFEVSPRASLRKITARGIYNWLIVFFIIGGVLEIASIIGGVLEIAGIDSPSPIGRLLIFFCGATLIMMTPIVIAELFRSRSVEKDAPASAVVTYHQPSHGYVVNYMVPSTGEAEIGIIHPSSSHTYKSNSGGSGTFG
jgi:hypothetical protein